MLWRICGPAVLEGKQSGRPSECQEALRDLVGGIREGQISFLGRVSGLARYPPISMISMISLLTWDDMERRISLRSSSRAHALLFGRVTRVC